MKYQEALKKLEDMLKGQITDVEQLDRPTSLTEIKLDQLDTPEAKVKIARAPSLFRVLSRVITNVPRNEIRRAKVSIGKG